MLLKTRLNNMDSRSVLKILAICPALAVTTTLYRALFMSCALIATLILAELIASVFKRTVATSFRDLAYVLITAFCASLVEIVIGYFSPWAATSLGVYLPILAISCIVLMRIESCACVSSVGLSLLDAAICGGEFALIMLGCSFLRELFGAGTLFFDGRDSGITVFEVAPLPILQSTAGVLLMAAFGAAFAKFVKSKRASAASNASENV